MSFLSTLFKCQPAPPRAPSLKFILTTTLDTGRQINSGVIEDIYFNDTFLYPAKTRAKDRAANIVKEGLRFGEIFYPAHRITEVEIHEC